MAEEPEKEPEYGVYHPLKEGEDVAPPPIVSVKPAEIEGHQFPRKKPTMLAVFGIACVGVVVVLILVLVDEPTHHDNPPLLPDRWMGKLIGSLLGSECRFQGWMYYDSAKKRVRTDWLFDRVDMGCPTSRTVLLDGKAELISTYSADMTGGGWTCVRGPLSGWLAPDFLQNATYDGSEWLRPPYCIGKEQERLLTSVFASTTLFKKGNITTFVTSDTFVRLDVELNELDHFIMWFADSDKGGVVATHVPPQVFEDDSFPAVACAAV